MQDGMMYDSDKEEPRKKGSAVDVDRSVIVEDRSIVVKG